MTDETYNGWTNRETWNAHLWITNDAYSDHIGREIVADALAKPTEYPDWTTAEQRTLAMSHAGDALREWWDDENGPDDDHRASPLADAWAYAIACVDWREIAEALAPEPEP